MSSSLTLFACIENVDRVISCLYQFEIQGDTSPLGSGMNNKCVMFCVLDLFMVK